MGFIRTIKGEDNKPFISLEDLISEIEYTKNFNNEYKKEFSQNINYIDIFLSTLYKMEEDYYGDFIFRLNKDDENDDIEKKKKKKK